MAWGHLELISKNDVIFVARVNVGLFPEKKYLTRILLKMHFRPGDCRTVYKEAFLNCVGHTRTFINYVTFIFVILTSYLHITHSYMGLHIVTWGSNGLRTFFILYSLLVQEQPQARAHLRLQSGTQTHIRVLSGHFTPKTW